MKALTICQPYAELIMLGEKRVENRTWATTYRGPLLIHAGKSRAWLRSYSPLPATLDFGMIVGRSILTACIPVNQIRLRLLPTRFDWLRDHWHVEGPWCWVLEDVQRFEQPIPYAGRQGLFVVDEILQDAVMIPAGPRIKRSTK